MMGTAGTSETSLHITARCQIPVHYFLHGNLARMYAHLHARTRRPMINKRVSMLSCTTRWFRYDRDKLWLVYTQIVPVIFEPPCILTVLFRLSLCLPFPSDFCRLPVDTNAQGCPKCMLGARCPWMPCRYVSGGIWAFMIHRRESGGL
jgi:hypothetical protein